MVDQNKEILARLSLLEQNVQLLMTAKKIQNQQNIDRIDFEPRLEIRHLRDKWLNQTRNRSGVTIVHDFNQESRVIRFGWAVCSDQDNFSRRTGVEIATRRYKEDPKFIVLPNFVEYDSAKIEFYIRDGIRCLDQLDPSYNDSKTIVDFLQNIVSQTA